MIYGSIVCLALSALIAFGNISGCIAAVRRKKKGIDRGYSNVPLLSLLFSVGAWYLGRTDVGLWAFLPAVVDPGTWMLVALIGSFKDKGNNTEQNDSR